MSIKRLHGTKSIVRITPDHYPMIKKWYLARGKKIDIENSISDMGYIVDGRVAGWLYVTNSNCAMIEGIIANPETVPSLRRQSLRKLVGFLVDTSVMLGFTNIFGVSKHPSVEKVAQEFGFKTSDTFKIFTLNANRD